MDETLRPQPTGPATAVVASSSQGRAQSASLNNFAAATADVGLARSGSSGDNPRAKSGGGSGAAARGTTGRVRSRGTSGRTANGGQDSRPSLLPPLAPQFAPRSVIHFIRVVPGMFWIALAVALTAAGVAGAFALRASRRARRQASEFAAVAAIARTDPLTDALNRRGFNEAVERELARARRYQTTFVLAYFDVRGLKRLNDREGHLAGDVLLKEVAALITESAREADVVGRIGGDEFGLLLTEQQADSAQAVTKRIRRRVADRRRSLKLEVPWDLTIGTAAYPNDGETLEELLATADRRLYRQRGIELVARRERSD